MKKNNFGILLILLIGGFCIFGCGSSNNLPKSFRDNEKGRIDAYLDFRADGAEFSPKFYNDRDSVFASLPKGEQKLISAYTIIASIRDIDSSRRYTHPSFFFDMKNMIDKDFDIVGRGNQQ